VDYDVKSSWQQTSEERRVGFQRWTDLRRIGTASCWTSGVFLYAVDRGEARSLSFMRDGPLDNALSQDGPRRRISSMGRRRDDR